SLISSESVVTVPNPVKSRIALATPERTLELVFSLFTSYMAYISFKRSRNPKLNIRNLNLGKYSYILAITLSIAIGIVTGTLGASGGIMFIAVMMLLFSVDIKKMIGTATLAMFFSAISGSSAYILAGKADVLASTVIGIIALFSGYYFAKLANRMNSKYIYIFLGSVFILTSLSELLKVIL
ncbi:MAG: sulfite exporter TauE/SafE family protein, partial [Sulfolobus sp.]|nr:sulfite exporter TauE/SafE family protein [Sulfolobus sp.]